MSVQPSAPQAQQQLNGPGAAAPLDGPAQQQPAQEGKKPGFFGKLFGRKPKENAPQQPQ